MALSGPALIARALRKAIRVPRSMGSAALALAYVANGRFDAFVQQGGLSLWDVAAAGLIAERGLSAVTLDAVADAAECSLPSLHTTFGGRDGLLKAIFERYGPILDVERLMADRPDSLEETVRELYKIVVAAFQREPRVFPALFADLLGRPDGPARRVLELNFPRILGTVGAWLMGEVRAGRIRPLPLPVLAQMLIAPVVLHLLSRPALEQVIELPSVEEVCEGFAGAYLRGVEVNPA
jgi:AcrR family transcriptional regulator